MSNINLQKLLFKIKNCGSYYMLHRLEENFNSVGLTIQQTLKDNKILCKIVDGEPVTKEAMEDYVFIGSMDEASNAVPSSIMDGILNFIVASASEEPAKLNEDPKVVRNGFYTYGRIMLVNEDVEKIAQNFISE